MLRTFYGRLAAALFVLFCVLALLLIGIQVFATRMYVLESNQRLHKELARSLVSEGLVGAGGEIRKERLEGVFHTLMVINPSIEVYLVDTAGKILAFSAPPGKVQLERISLGPVRAFLERPGNVPVFGDDPRRPGRRAVFSAAPVSESGTVRGFLYVVLEGEPYQTAFDALRSSYMARLSVGLVIAAAIFVLAASLVFLGLLTRRLRALVTDVESLQPDVAGRGVSRDEVDLLDRSFRRMAERIHEQVQDLRRADSERRQLITNISHDLRTPLSSVQGYLETLLVKEGSLGLDERREYLRAAVGNVDRLSRLIDELFELAKLDAPETRLHLEAFPLPELIQDVGQKLRVYAEAKGVDVEVRVSEDIPFVRGDIGLLERALENLLKNAIEHSPEGCAVSIGLEQKGSELEMRVSDRGPGIDPEDLPHIFERFYRGRDRKGNTGKGTGLGLAIVRRIAELHGGAVEAWNDPGGGATFCLRLRTT